MAQVSIDPKLWATVRKLAFDQQVTASRLVTTAIEEYLGRLDGPKTANKPGDKPPAGVAMKLHHDLPWDKPIGVVTSVVETPDGIAVEGERVQTDGAIAPPASMGAVIVAADEQQVVIEDGEYKLTPQAMAAKAAELADQKGREFHPVPKPASTKRPRR